MLSESKARNLGESHELAGSFAVHDVHRVHSAYGVIGLERNDELSN